MTLKKFEKLLDDAKAAIYKRIKEDPKELQGAEDFFEGYFMTGLFNEILGSHEDARKAFDKWLKTTSEISNLEYEENYHNVVKEFLNARFK